VELRRNRRFGYAIVGGLVISLALIVASPILPRLVPRATAHFAGTGETLTSTQHLADGWYEAAWTARASNRPVQGCLFGLRIDQVALDASPDQKERRPFSWDNPKLTYRTVAADAVLTGSSAPRLLPAGDYRLIVDGSCAWDVEVRPVDPPPLPSGLEYGGPRMDRTN
jgi:hypothetical protein